MFDKNRVKGFVSYALVICLFVLAFIIVKPVFESVIYGLLLAYITYPIYSWINSKIKIKTVSAAIVCISFISIIVIIAGFLFSSLFKQAVNFYLFFREVDIGNTFVSLIAKFLPIVSTPTFPINLASTINTFISTILSNSFNQLSNVVLNAPVIILNLFIVLLVFFYSLREGKEIIEYIKSLAPFNKETQDRFFKQFKDITSSVILGHIVVGLIQGLFAGIGYYIFGVPNALLLTILTSIVAIIPLGAWIGWVPVDIFLFASGKTGAALGLLIYGLFFISTLDNILRMIIVSRRTEVNSAVVLIGMIGGGFVFGFLGFIIGPLVLAYVILVIELYKKTVSGDDVKKLEV